MFDHFQGFKILISLKFWLGILGAALPWIIAVPIIVFALEFMQIEGDSKSHAGIGAIVAVFFVIFVSFFVSFFIKVPSDTSSFSYFFKRSSIACVTIYTLTLVMDTLDRLQRR
jgi:hypothetical protein